MFKYVDPERFIPGIPARDISDEEAAERGITDLLHESATYKHIGKAPVSAAPAAVEPDAPANAEGG